MLTLIETMVFAVLLLLTIYGFFRPLYIRYRLVRTGLPENRFDTPLKRVIDAVTSFFFLRCSLKKERVFTGLVHFFILYGSLTFDTVSVSHIFEGFNPDFRLFGHGFIGKFHSAWVDVFAIMVLLATLYFIIRRYIIRPKAYDYSTWDSAIIYTLLITVTITFILYVGADIALKPEHGQWAFLGKTVAKWLSPSADLVKLLWWIHIINVFIFIAYVPRSKYIHMIFGPINIAFRNHKTYAIVKPIDIENAEVFGAAHHKDFTWKDLFDGFACLDCGRCQDYCPAYATEKALSPRDIMINLRKSMLAEQKVMRGVQEGDSSPLMGDIFTPEEIWACTTCGACQEVCPVKNEHVPKIIQLRQGQVLMEAKFPNELKNAFKGWQTNANPWGMGANNRLNWAEGLEIPKIEDNPDAEYLLYLGCAAAFDDRAQKISRVLIQFLQQQGISFALLGENEQCCGETARRLGEEGVGQMLMQANIELFKELNIKKILTSCPHCFNTFKNEYPLLGGHYEVIHHTQMIQQMLAENKIQLDQERTGKVVIHDSCYLGRANHIYSPSRDILAAIPGLERVEHPKSKDHGFCCGAGGGLFWTEEHEPRVNHERVRQLTSVGADTIATSCPYCVKMLDDGLKDLQQEDKIKAMDLLEILMSG